MSAPPDPRAALLQSIDAALARLAAGPLTDESVHQVRRHIKRARAALRLLRDAAGEPPYARENAALRDAARRLCALRDSRVVLQALEGIGEDDPTLRRRHATLLRAAAAPSVRAALQRALAASRARCARRHAPTTGACTSCASR